MRGRSAVGTTSSPQPGVLGLLDQSGCPCIGVPGQRGGQCAPLDIGTQNTQQRRHCRGMRGILGSHGIAGG